MEIANCAKRFDGAFHGIAAERAVNVNIDKSRRKITSVKVDRVFAACSEFLDRPRKPRRSRANLGDFRSFDDNFEAVANSIWKN
jgi:hypothetical protein